jgi:hypothetical protein
MRKFKSNLPLSIGIILFAATLIASHCWDLPDMLYCGLTLLAVALELLGVIILARSPEMKNSRLRRWKLRLIGKEPK